MPTSSADLEWYLLFLNLCEGMQISITLSALEQALDESGWAPLGQLGSLLIQLKPDFDSRLYGFKKLSDLVKAHPAVFTLESRPVPGTPNVAMYVQAK